MVAQALCKDYHLNKGPARCMLKVDIHKAFDSINWVFLRSVLCRMGFPQLFVNWLMTCVSTGMYSIKINGALEGFFEAKSGLRQGDAISPYLFVLSMEVVSACIKKFTTHGVFKHHWRAKETELTHITFADDILFLSKGKVESVQMLMHGLNLFSSISGLKPNVQKSNCFFANARDQAINDILVLTGFL